MDDVKQTQNPAIGFVMKKKTRSNTSKVRNGRPPLKVDFAILLRLREGDHLGWSRVAQEYLKITGQLISRETLERRYLRYKAIESAGKLVVNVDGIPLKKTDGQRIVVEKIVITRMPDSMKKIEKPTQSENV